MTAVDSSSLVAVLRREPEATEFLHIIELAQTRLISAVAHLETSIVLAGRGGGRTAWLPLDALLRRASFQIVPHDAGLAEAAREAFLRFGKGLHPAALNFGDCAVHALAKTRGVPLLFKGEGFSATDLVAAV